MEEFKYTFSAKEQEEVSAIRKKYLPEEEDKLARLRRLDAGVTKKATMISLIFGILGTLTMGGGMSLVMVGAHKWFALGLAIGIIGMAALSAAYPLYAHIIKKEREKIAPEILRLSEELLK